MKYIMLSIVFFIISFLNTESVFAQTISEKLNAVKNVEQAEYFIEKNPGTNASLVLLNAETDTTAAAKEIFNKKNLEVFKTGSYSCKIVEKKKALLFRASYIYLDASKLSMKKIDSIRNVILEKFKNGIPFNDLFKEYNMDGNTNSADLGYFEEGVMASQFESAVRSRKKGEIFKVDVPDKNWYYIVYKTHDNIFTPVIRLLRVENHE